jgi:environmental stress-induced protein Ves
MGETLQKISPDQFVTSTWRGGKTRQIAISPPGADYARRDFLWRISSATVDLEASDFTLLPEYERFLATLSGTVDLRHGGGEAVTLSPGTIHRFDGGGETRSHGRCQDFNLMVRKGRCSGQMWGISLPEQGKLRFLPLDKTGELLVYCVDGSGVFSAAGEEAFLAPGEAGLARGGSPVLESRGASMFYLCEMKELCASAPERTNRATTVAQKE